MKSVSEDPRAPGAKSPEVPEARAGAERLLLLVREVAEELHPHRKFGAAITLDHSLDSDLGFDSLGRAELLFRIEQTLAVALPDQLLSTAETPRDLLRAIASAEGAAPAAIETAITALTLETVDATPEKAATLMEVLQWHEAAHPERPHITFIGEGNRGGGEHGEEDGGDTLTYGALAAGAREVAAGLSALELVPGQAVAIMLPSGPDYFFAFHGVLRAGGVPVPIYPPFRPAQLEEHLRRHTAILANALAPILITLPEGRAVTRLLQNQLETLRHVASVEDLRASGGRPPPAAGKGGDIALLQYTSGSTGNPKGVVLTHDNLLANIRAMGRALEVGSNDVFVSWLPLYHDMGLIGACLATLYHATPLVLMPPLAFMARPERWLWAIHRHRGTLTAGVNFAYDLCLSKVRDERLVGLDLSSLRIMLNGAEPVVPDTLLRFVERFGRHGLRPEAMAPVFGLAECSVGLAFPPLGREPLIDRVRRDVFLAQGRAVAAAPEEGEGLRFVACGQPLPNHQFRVVDEAGKELGDRDVGRLQFRGPSATSGYFRNPEATAELFHGDWLDTGDLAYIAAGDVYPTGRAKDIIIRAGRNLHPHELEHAVGELEGIRRGCVAVFGSNISGGNISGRNTAGGGTAGATERLVVVAEARERDEQKRDALTVRIEGLAMELMGSAPDDIVLAPPHSVLKTSSGKIRRAAMRELYERGLLGRRQAKGWSQGPRRRLEAALVAVAPTLRRLRRRAGELAFGARVYSVFLPIALACWFSVALLPRPALAWPVTRFCARFFLRLAGIPVRVVGLENLPREGGYVLAANHCSYPDSLILAAVLPVNLSYVAKGELEAFFISRLFMRRLGCEFVERSDAKQSLGDARRIAKQMREGRRLMFFPEGTFTRVPGLRPFHLGAFTAAVEGRSPVVPIVLRGTRSLLREGRLLPRRAAIGVQVFPPIPAPEGDGFAAAIELRDATRVVLLRHCGEPDLERMG